MKKPMLQRMAGFLAAFVVVSVFGVQISAAPVKDSLAGDWRVEVDYDGRQMVSVVSFSRNKQGELAGQWISLWGIGELSNIRQEGNRLSFTQTSRFGGREFTSNFTGTIQKAALSGTLSSERGESKVQGRRIGQMSQAAGEWETTVSVNGQEYPGTLAIKAGEKGRLKAIWQSQWGEHEITDVVFKGGKLTFTRKSKVQDRQWTSTFEGTIKGQTLSGALTSDEGKIPLQGKRVGAAVIGTWDLKIASDSGSRAQRLRVYPDLSGMYGSLPIDKLKLEGNRVSFTAAADFGDQKFDISFTGTLDGGTIRGELTSPRGARTVEGVTESSISKVPI